MESCEKRHLLGSVLAGKLRQWGWAERNGNAQQKAQLIPGGAQQLGWTFSTFCLKARELCF